MLVRNVLLRRPRVTLPPQTRLQSTTGSTARPATRSATRSTTRPKGIPVHDGVHAVSLHLSAPAQLPRMEPPKRVRKLTTLTQYLTKLARERQKKLKALDSEEAGSTETVIKAVDAKAAEIKPTTRRSVMKDAALWKTTARAADIKAAKRGSRAQSTATEVKLSASVAMSRKRPSKSGAAKPPPRVSLRSDQSKHHDLESFIAYAAVHSLNTSSSVYRGTNYEYAVQQALRSYHFNLHRTGRSNDLGIDLLGEWSLPHEMAGGRQAKELKVLIQCKLSAGKPCNMRELEGAYVGAPAGWRGDGVMAFLVSSKPATLGVRGALQRSRLPMGFLQVTEGGQVQQFIWNHVAQEARLAGMSTTHTYSTSMNKQDDVPEGKIALMYQGRRL